MFVNIQDTYSNMPRSRNNGQQPNPPNSTAELLKLVVSLQQQVQELRAATKHNIEEVIKMMRFLKDGVGGTLLPAVPDAAYPHIPTYRASFSYTLK